MVGQTRYAACGSRRDQDTRNAPTAKMVAPSLPVHVQMRLRVTRVPTGGGEQSTRASLPIRGHTVITYAEQPIEVRVATFSYSSFTSKQWKQ